jgi:hypothetical protein
MVSLLSLFSIIGVTIFLTAVQFDISTGTSFLLSATVCTTLYFTIGSYYTSLLRASKTRVFVQRPGKPRFPDVPTRDAEPGDHQCPVCMTSACNIALDPCGHIFCVDCIKTYQERNSTCPLCRTEVEAGVKVYLKKEDIVPNHAS